MTEGLVDRWSFATLCVVPYAFSAALATGSGFTARSPAGNLYLITNYHVALGRHPDTNRPLDPAGHVPDRLMLAMLRERPPEGPQLDPGTVDLSWGPLVHLLDDGEPLWQEHPRFGRRFDAVALPLDVPPEFRRLEPATSDDQVALFPGSTVSVVGFPHGLAGPGLTAIWKTGAIASEPHLLTGEEDYFWIDANTRSGMSGAPVLARRLGTFLTTSGGLASAAAPVDRILGVYAGRAVDSPDMTLGRVWRWRGVLEILVAADRRAERGVLRARSCTLGHFGEVGMPTIQHRAARIDVPGIVSGDWTSAKLLRTIAAADKRFNASLKGVMKAAELVAACDTAGELGAIEVTSETAKMIAASIRDPEGWGYPTGAYQLLEFLRALLADLGQPEAA